MNFDELSRLADDEVHARLVQHGTTEAYATQLVRHRDEILAGREICRILSRHYRART